MAINIISPGQDERPVYTRTCPECKCKFEYQYSDTQDSGWLGGFRAVLCPHCGYPVAHLVAGGGADINHPISED
jgi:hypothetical protein